MLEQVGDSIEEALPLLLRRHPGPSGEGTDLAFQFRQDLREGTAVGTDNGRDLLTAETAQPAAQDVDPRTVRGGAFPQVAAVEECSTAQPGVDSQFLYQ